MTEREDLKYITDIAAEQSGRDGREVRQAGSSPRPRRWAPRPPRPISTPDWLPRNQIVDFLQERQHPFPGQQVIETNRAKRRVRISHMTDPFCLKATVCIMVRIKPFRAVRPPKEHACRGGFAPLRRAQLGRRRKAEATRAFAAAHHQARDRLRSDRRRACRSAVYDKAVENFRRWRVRRLAAAGRRGALLYLCADDGRPHAVRSGDVLPFRGLSARGRSRSTS